MISIGHMTLVALFYLPLFHLFEKVLSCSIDEINKVSREFSSLSISGIVTRNENSYYSITSSSLANFPVDIINLIYDYCYWENYLELYEKIMRRLNLSQEDRNGLNFHNLNFPNQLYWIIAVKKVSIYRYESFWFDLTRLALKWIFYMRQTVRDRKDFDEMDAIMKKITIHLSKKTRLNISFDLIHLESSAGKKSNFFTLKELINCEIAERPNVNSIFNSISDRFYKGEINCKSLENEYFASNFDNDQLLKSMILLHDHEGKIKKCLLTPSSNHSISSTSKNDSSNSFFSSFLSIFLPFTHMFMTSSLYSIPFSNESSSDEVSDDDFEIYHMKFISKPIINFFMENKKKIKIWSSHDLIVLLKKLKELKLLTRKIIENSTEFNIVDPDQVSRMDQFKEYLTKEKEHLLPLEYQEYLDLIS